MRLYILGEEYFASQNPARGAGRAAVSLLPVVLENIILRCRSRMLELRFAVMIQMVNVPFVSSVSLRRA